MTAWASDVEDAIILYMKGFQSYIDEELVCTDFIHNLTSHSVIQGHLADSCQVRNASSRPVWYDTSGATPTPLWIAGARGQSLRLPPSRLLEASRCRYAHRLEGLDRSGEVPPFDLITTEAAVCRHCTLTPCSLQGGGESLV